MMIRLVPRLFLGALMKRFSKTIGSSGGFTLIEMLVAVSIMVIVTGIFGAGLFQVFSIQRFWTDDIKATRTVRHAGSWLAGDALNAAGVFAGEPAGVPAVLGDPLGCPDPDSGPDAVTLVWTDSNGLDNWAVYRLDTSAGVLFRDYWLGTEENEDPTASNGVSLTMTTGVKSLEFTLCPRGDGLTLRSMMDVTSDRDNVETLDLVTYIRKLD